MSHENNFGYIREYEQVKLIEKIFQQKVRLDSATRLRLKTPVTGQAVIMC